MKGGAAAAAARVRTHTRAIYTSQAGRPGSPRRNHGKRESVAESAIVVAADRRRPRKSDHAG